MSQSRQLAAIMFTDIVGYTSIMGESEEFAMSLLSKNREIQGHIIEQFKGRWIKEMGDGILASFDSASDAVNAAIKIQEESKNIRGLELRIGLHLAEVVFENEDVYGDGINIAARIQAISNPREIYVSEAIHSNVSNKTGIVTRFVKEQKLKNVNDPIRIFKVLTSHSGDSSPLSLRNQASKSSVNSIAVLPFVNMSNDPDQEYFCDGISEEIIDTLAQINNLRVVARTSAFSFKGKNIDVREIGKALDVSSLLEGSVRKSGKRLRITTKLVQVSDGSHLWTMRYDRELEDIFAIQEDIAKNVATELKGVLTSKEREIIRPQKAEIEAYECFLKGRKLFHQFNLVQAKQLFKQAIHIDPNYGPAYAGLSNVYSQLYEWKGANKTDLEKAEAYSLKALALAPNLAESHSSYGVILALRNHYEEAEREFNEAIQLNPNSFDTYYRYGRWCYSLGLTEKSAEMFLKASEVDKEDFQSLILLSQSLNMIRNNDGHDAMIEGMKRVRRRLELDPADRRALSIGSISLFENGDEEESFRCINKALELYPNDLSVLFNAACLYAKAGKKDKALNFLQIAIENGYGNKAWIEHDSDYDSLRDEPRFKELMKKIS